MSISDKPIPLEATRLGHIKLEALRPHRRRLRLLERLSTALLAAAVIASCALRFSELYANELLPDGYTRSETSDPLPHGRLDAGGHSLPLARLDEDDSRPTHDDDSLPDGESHGKSQGDDTDDDLRPDELRIVEYDLSGSGLSNETGYSPNLEALLDEPLPFGKLSTTQTATSDEPLVLLMHTHGSEAYSPNGATSYPLTSGMRSYDISENVVAVGIAVAERLESLGVGVLHLTEMFDYESYYNSYNRSLEAVIECLEEFPSIRFVIDLHRDAAADTSRMTAYKPVTELNGEKYAQLMLVVGTDYLGAAHENWENNLNVALKLGELMREVSPSLVRPINLRGASFNQQYCPGSLLLEVGSCSNTLDEAKRSGRVFADSLAELIRENGLK